MSPLPSSADTAIVGAGISGLALAYFLKARGVQAHVLEAAPRSGGTILSEMREGFLLEGGPSALLDNEPVTQRLVDALGLRARMRLAGEAAHHRFVLLKGRPQEVPSSPPALLSSGLLSWGAKFRAARELFVGSAPADDESVAAFATRHFGPEVATLFDAMQSGIFAGDATKLSVRSAFPKLAALEKGNGSIIRGAMRAAKGRPHTRTQLCSFDQGLEVLPRALAAQLEPHLTLGARVVGLSRQGEQWNLGVETGEGQRTLTARRVVLAVPAYVAAALVRPLHGPLASALEEIEYAPVATVHLGYPLRPDGAPALNGFGLLAPASEARAILGVIFASSCFPWRAPEGLQLLTCMMGGARKPEVRASSETHLVEQATSEVGGIFGLTTPPATTVVYRWSRAIPQYNVGHSERLRHIDERASRLPGLFLSGNAYRGVGINDCVRNAEELASRLTLQPQTSQ